jgi:hypothetical protein
LGRLPGKVLVADLNLGFQYAAAPNYLLSFLGTIFYRLTSLKLMLCYGKAEEKAAM